jgi:hypothetical protein
MSALVLIKLIARRSAIGTAGVLLWNQIIADDLLLFLE